jgi:hypothetical protein
MFHFVWAVAVFVLGSLIAFDYRNLALRVYDVIGMVSPGGSPSPRFTPDHLRIVWGYSGGSDSQAGLGEAAVYEVAAVLDVP